MTGDPDNDIYVIFSTTIFSAEVRLEVTQR